MAERESSEEGGRGSQGGRGRETEERKEVKGEGEGKTDEGVECGDTMWKVSTEQAQLCAQKKVSDKKRLEERKKTNKT